MIVVDRVEGGVAVCETEDQRILNIPLRAISGAVGGGELLERRGSGYVILRQETEKRRKKLAELTASLLRDPDEDL